MPNFSNPDPRTETNTPSSQEDVALEVLEFHQKQGYHTFLRKITYHFQGLIEDIFRRYPERITFPIDTKPMEHFLLGFEIEYCPLEEILDSILIPHFCNPFDSEGNDPSPRYLEGFWFADENMRRIYVYTKTSSSGSRQMFTKIHELFHFCQSLDPAFIQFLEEIISSSALPSKLVRKLIERSANKATAMYLIPEKHLKEKYRETQHIGELARFYGVSQDTLKIRLEECGFTSSTNDFFDTF